MPEPLVASDHVVVEADPVGGWAARDWVPGPAGTAGLVLAGGIELEVDVASPATFVGLWVPADPTARATGALDRLLGGERAASLLAVAAGPTVLGERDRRATRFARRRPGGRGTDRPPGVDLRLVTVALAEAAAASRDPMVRALGHLEAAAAGRRLPGGVGRRGRARAAALAGAELLLDLARRGELDGQPVDGAVLAGILGGVVPLLPEALRPAAGAVGDGVAAGRYRFAPVPGPVPWVAAPDALETRAAGGARRRLDEQADAMAPMAAPVAASAPAGPPTKKVAVAPLLELDRGGLPLDLVAVGVAVRATAASEAEVRIPGRADEAHRWWARAHGADGVVLAAAPFVPDDSDALARLLVPPAQLHHLTVDVTDQPGEPRPSASTLAALAAVEAGQAAARAERLGLGVEAAGRWRRCAAAWEEAGADAKAGLARQYAADAGGPAPRIPPPLLADPALEAEYA